MTQRSGTSVKLLVKIFFPLRSDFLQGRPDFFIAVAYARLCVAVRKADIVFKCTCGTAFCMLGLNGCQFGVNLVIWFRNCW